MQYRNYIDIPTLLNVDATGEPKCLQMEWGKIASYICLTELIAFLLRVYAFLLHFPVH